jgi:mRNA-degrading endonuclease RelE of RelBE toxin-antitoxin system
LADPSPHAGDIRKLSSSQWRLRFSFDEERVIVVLRVLPRGRAYDR